MNFAIRHRVTKELHAVIPIRAKRNDESLAVAMLWDTIDVIRDPWEFEYCRLTTVDKGDAGKWKQPGEWKRFEGTANDYYEVLRQGGVKS